MVQGKFVSIMFFKCKITVRNFFSSIQSLHYYNAAERIKREILLPSIQNDALQCNTELLGMVILNTEHCILYA